MRPAFLWLVLAAAGCRTAAEPAPTRQGPAEEALLAAAARTTPAFEARRLAEVCWPSVGDSPQRVALTFVKESGALKDVMFEPVEGAPNGIARCIQQVAWLYPWGASAPDTMTLAPPPVRPSGWVVLAYVTLLAERSFPPSRGVLNPAPLLSACMAHGAGVRPSLRFRVQTQPVHVTAFQELAVQGNREPEAARIVTDSERCAQAVLASTVYPGTRPFELDFSDASGAPAPAPPSEVAPYFAPPGAADATGVLDPTAAQVGIAALRPAVSKCWEAALARRAGLWGARTFRIHVTGNGRVDFAHVMTDRSTGAEGEAADYLLDRCLTDAVSGARFDPPAGGPADFSYAWVFARR